MADSTVKVNFLGDASSLKKATNDADGHLGKIASSIGGIAKAAAIGFAAAGVAAGAFAKSAVDAASNLAESQGKVNVVFKEQAKEIEAWADKSAKAFGQSKQSALEAVGTFGNLFQAFGLGRKESAVMSKSLVELAADLASFNNTSVDDALVALRSGLSGEAEPLKRYGVAINDARLKTEALSMGLIKSTKDALTPAAKAQASYALILKDTALAQGDFARTSDGLANKTRIVKAQFADLQAEIGAKLLPIAVQLASALSDKLFPAIERIGNDPKFKQFMTDVGAVAKEVFGWMQENVPKILGAIADFIDKHVIPALQSIGHWIREDVKPAIDKMVKAFKEDLWPTIEQDVIPALKKIWTWVHETLAPALGDFITIIIEDVIPALFKMVRFIDDEVVPKIKAIVAPLLELYEVIDKITSLLFGRGGDFDPAGILKGLPQTVGGEKWVPGFAPVPGFPGTGAGPGERFGGLASGGIVTKPTLKWVGERGPEAVIPLSRGGGIGNTYNITVQSLDPRSAEQLVIDAIRGYESNNGFVPIRRIMHRNAS